MATSFDMLSRDNMINRDPLPWWMQSGYRHLLPMSQNADYSGVFNPVGVAPASNPAAPAETIAPVATPATTPVPTPAPTPAPPSLDQLRTQFLNDATSRFGTNYGKTLVPDSSLDNTINTILNEQRGGAQSYLDRGLARGIFNPTGYSAGQNRLTAQGDAARSNLFNLGEGVVGRYQDEANQVRDRAFSGISGLTEGQQFSLDPYFAEGEGIKEKASSRASGDLRAAVGGTNYFDFGNLSQTAGKAQGAVNLRDADVATALAERKRRGTQSRGLGSQGAF